MAGRSVAQPRGMALIAVLWMVAALGIIATGLLHTVKGEIRLAGHQRQNVVAGALADAAIRWVLQDVSARKPALVRSIYIDVPLQGGLVRTEVRPLNGLIDLNQAPEPLLAALFQHAAGLPPADSAQLAQAVVETRKRPDPQGRPEGFDAPEDLLRVPGVSYPLYATIARLVSASLKGSGRVNPQAAPVPVLAVLAQGNTALASQLAAARDSSPLPMDTAQLTPDFIDSSAATAIQVAARVPLADGAHLVKTWWVGLSASGQTGLPWQVLETRQHIEPLAP